MNQKTADAIQRLVADWPPFTEDTKRKLAVLLQSGQPDDLQRSRIKPRATVTDRQERDVH